MTTALLNHVYATIGKSFRRVHTFDMMVVIDRVERGGTVLKKSFLTKKPNKSQHGCVDLNRSNTRRGSFNTSRNADLN